MSPISNYAHRSSYRRRSDRLERTPKTERRLGRTALQIYKKTNLTEIVLFVRQMPDALVYLHIHLRLSDKYKTRPRSSAMTQEHQKWKKTPESKEAGVTSRVTELLGASNSCSKWCHYAGIRLPTRASRNSEQISIPLQYLAS